MALPWELRRGIVEVPLVMVWEMMFLDTPPTVGCLSPFLWLWPLLKDLLC